MSGKTSFMGSSFLLTCDYAKELYDSYAKKMPIFDYHCHLSAKEIWDDVKFDTITDAWLNNDHYKWRLMRAVGVEEKFVTGTGDKLQKFNFFVEALNKSPQNPVYHWAHRELAAYFGINDPLTAQNSEEVFYKTKEMLREDWMSVRSLIKKSNVTALFTTDDPSDALVYHKKLREDDSFDVRVIPAFRPDKAFAIDGAGFAGYIRQIGESAGIEIDCYNKLVDALRVRLSEFVSLGAKASDLSLSIFPYALGDAETVFKKALSGYVPNEQETEIYKTALLISLAEEYSKNGVVMELHIGALRNQNSVMFERVGADTGFDAMYDLPVTYKLGRLLDHLKKNNILPKTIVFPLNPADFLPVNILLGCFNSPGVQLQLGAAWWHNDHLSGIKRQLDIYSSTGALGGFLGMLTDSRSFFSYERHDYFRRILSSFLGECVENGEFIPDVDVCGKIIENICYNNAVNFFGLEL